MPIETKNAPRAVVILTQQYHDARVKHAEELAQVAFDAVGLDPKDGWRFNVDTATYERILPDPMPEESADD